VGVGPHRLGGGLSPPPPRPPGSFTARCRSLAMFQHPPLLPQNPAAAQSPPVGFQPAQKNARFSTTPPARFLSAAGGFLGRNLTLFDSLKIKSGQEFSGRHLIFSDWFFLRVRWRAQKSGRPGVRDAGLESRGEGTAQRQDFAPHWGVSDHVHRPSGSACLKKARRVQRGKAFSSLLGFGA